MTPITDKIVETIQQNAESMDIIFLGTNDLIGKLIEKAEDCQTDDGKTSLWSHVCLFVNKETIIESTIGFEPYRNGSRWDNGVEYFPLYERIKSSGYNTSLVHIPLSKRNRKYMLKTAEQLFEDGITYPILGLIGSLLTYYLFPKWKKNPLANQKRSLYCSAFVSKVYGSIGLKFSETYEYDNISPQMVWNSLQTFPADILNISRKNELIIQ